MTSISLNFARALLPWLLLSGLAPGIVGAAGVSSDLKANASVGGVEANLSLGFQLGTKDGSGAGTAPVVMEPSRALSRKGLQPADNRVDSRARGLDDLGGHFEATVGGKPVVLPMLKTDIEADIRGDLMTVTVSQTFANPATQAMHATYLFPLHEDAAVFAMTMRVGDELVQAQIKEVQEAQKTFEAAKSEGKSAALLKQHRPNMFTQDIANLMPGLPITVKLSYVQTLSKEDGSYEVVMPLVVGPRYQPAGAGEKPAGGLPADLPRAAEGKSPASTPAPDSKKPFGQWEVEALPVYPLVAGLDIPEAIEPERVSIQVHLDGGMPVSAIASETHAITVARRSPDRLNIALAKGRVIDNRDFVLKYRLAGSNAQAGLLSYRDDRGGFFSLLIEPPAVPAAVDIMPREMVFVLDCSGSMDGLPLETSKAFMRQALRGLRPTDTFRIIRFSDGAHEFSSSPLEATPKNIEHAIHYTDRLEGEGGTEMTTGIRQALSVPVPEGTLRLVTFLTDGYIGNEHEVLSLIGQHIGQARLFALGVGSSVNRYLLAEMGKMGRGFTRFMGLEENGEAVAAELAARLDAPVLTDIRIDWGQLEPTDMVPTLIPDLFAGQSVRVQGRFKRAGSYELAVQGRVNGRPARLPLRVTLEARSTDGEAVALVWARSAIAQAMDDMLSPADRRSPGRTDDSLKQHVTDLGLKFSLVTQWTAFVAVSKRVVNPNPANTLHADVPLPMVEGISEKAYGERLQATGSSQTFGSIGSSSGFSGSSAPEPELIGGLIIAACAAALSARRRRTRREPGLEG